MTRQVDMAARNRQIREQFADGLSLSKIAEAHQITESRVCQILKVFGLRRYGLQRQQPDRTLAK